MNTQKKCLYCQNDTWRDSSSLCLDHFNRHKENARKNKARRLKNKLCIKCDQPQSENGGLLCDHHQKLNREKANKVRSRRVESGMCGNCGKIPTKRNQVCPSCRAVLRSYPQNNRQAVLNHYGKKCSCCGITEDVFLTVDHKNNDGTIDRKENKGGSSLYRRIIKNGFPETFQILCWNCNSAKHLLGRCPHQNQ